MKKIFVASTLAVSVLLSTAAMVAPTQASAQEVYATNGSQIVNTAKSYMGKVKYRYSTRDTKNLILDCSSFTQLVFQKNGVKIPWGSKAQTSFGKKVASKSQLAVGDLIMFSVGTPGKINHVGIYIGNGKFIGNSPSTGVAISDLNKGYWSTRYITARHY